MRARKLLDDGTELEVFIDNRGNGAWALTIEHNGSQNLGTFASLKEIGEIGTLIALMAKPIGSTITLT